MSRGWADVATKRDLDGLRLEFRADIESLRAEMERGFRRVVMWMASFVVGGLVAGMGLAAAIAKFLQ